MFLTDNACLSNNELHEQSNKNAIFLKQVRLVQNVLDLERVPSTWTVWDFPNGSASFAAARRPDGRY